MRSLINLLRYPKNKNDIIRELVYRRNPHEFQQSVASPYDNYSGWVSPQSISFPRAAPSTAGPTPSGIGSDGRTVQGAVQNRGTPQNNLSTTGEQGQQAAPVAAPGQPTPGDPRGMIPIIRASAIKYGHDPDVAVQVARSEGLGTFAGDHGKSFGAFQAYTGGGIGNEYQKTTGKDPSDPANEPHLIDYQMSRLNRDTWSLYHGAARAGIGSHEGIGINQPQPTNTATSNQNQPPSSQSQNDNSTINKDSFLQDPRNLRFGSGAGRPDIHPNVINWLNNAGPAAFGPGWHAELSAGPANHTPGTYTTGGRSQVTLGQAADVYLIDPQGNRIPHPVDIGSSDPNFSPYAKLGQEYIMASGGQGRWGGNYGRPDRMQYGMISPGYPAGANADPDLYAKARQQFQTQMAANDPSRSSSPSSNNPVSPSSSNSSVNPVQTGSIQGQQTDQEPQQSISVQSHKTTPEVFAKMNQDNNAQDNPPAMTASAPPSHTSPNPAPQTAPPPPNPTPQTATPPATPITTPAPTDDNKNAISSSRIPIIQNFHISLNENRRRTMISLLRP